MITLYINEGCGTCNLIEDFLKLHNVEFKKVSITSEKCPNNILNSDTFPILDIDGELLYSPDLQSLNKKLSLKLPVHNKVYLDYAATTPVYEESLNEMIRVYKYYYGNPSSGHSIGFKSHNLLNQIRLNISKILDCKPSEIIFTSSGSESNNLALKGIAFANKGKGNHIIVSSIEHKSILNSCMFLKTCGFQISYAPVDKKGNVNIDWIKENITNKTILISVMYANNELGTIQNISEINQIAKEKNIIFHTDAVQYIGHKHFSFNKLGIDAASLSSHKFYGPKGSGILICKESVDILPIISGGAQENNNRAGTENVASIMGMYISLNQTINKMKTNEIIIKELRQYLIDKILKYIPDAHINGNQHNSLYNIINITLPSAYYDVGTLLDFYNICVSKGSACLLSNQSHVLSNIGLTDIEIKNTIRISLSAYTTYDDLNYLVKTLLRIIAKKKD